jgi:hypothetical protein
VVFLGGALIAAVAGSPLFVVVLLILTAITTAACVRTVFDANDAGWTTLVTELDYAVLTYDPGNWFARHAAAYYHRHYIVPDTDMDKEAASVWNEAATAANKVRESEVVRQGIIDSPQVAMALPQQSWDIAEGLARLSEVRGRQREILGQVEPGNPDIAAKFSSQGRRLTLAAGHIEERVRKLQELAGLVGKADALVRRAAALGRLGELDDLIRDLNASTEDMPADLDPVERLQLEVRAVIEQANEVTRGLAFPDDDDQDEDEPDA